MQYTDSPLPSPFRGGQLRRLRPGDLAAFQAYRSVPQLARFQGWSVLSDQKATEFLTEMNAAPLFTPDQWVQIAIADSSDDRLIGDIGIFLAGDQPSGEIGFTLALEAQGRGLATEAVRKALQLVFELTPVEEVFGITDSRNTASIRVLQRAGFEYLDTRNVVFRGEACAEDIYSVQRG
jgi:RimJ/RimL family protein N-acetyltransferase